jgi:hypothetical protein
MAVPLKGNTVIDAEDNGIEKDGAYILPAPNT